MANIFNHLMCPNCFNEWTFEEIDNQVCDSCGFPNHQKDDDDDITPDCPRNDGADYDGPRGREAEYEERDRMHYCQTHLK
jgi:hypothetical protein